jgi:hypothetical protein
MISDFLSKTKCHHLYIYERILSCSESNFKTWT